MAETPEPFDPTSAVKGQLAQEKSRSHTSPLVLQAMDLSPRPSPFASSEPKGLEPIQRSFHAECISFVVVEPHMFHQTVELCDSSAPAGVSSVARLVVVPMLGKGSEDMVEKTRCARQ